MTDFDDRKGQICTKCGVGNYQETSIHDDWDGVLHCTNKECNHEVKRYKSKDEPKPESMENTALSPEAQAVLDAANQAYDQAATVAQGTAAAICAAAEPFHWTWNAEMCHKHLITIAQELEALPND
jgi:hypothetical protein